MNEYVELTQAGNWYTLEIEYDDMHNAFKANGSKQLNELIDDLVHDCKIDEKFNLLPQLEGMRK
jgi:hypothetical protein